jgi:AraC-like DNA-binding protein
MPAIHDESFRAWFYPRWGRENCVVTARTRHVEMPPYQQRLSIKAAWGGTEDYFLDARRVGVDDDNYLILNEARTYGSCVRGARPVTSFAVFFRPGMLEDVVRCQARAAAALLADPDGAGSIEFCEQLRPHDRVVTPLLRHMLAHIESGAADEAWLEDELYRLLARMCAVHRQDLAAAALLPVRRASTRRELQRRVALCVDFIHANFSRPIGLTQIAAAAHLSPYHCLRVFKSLQGITPMVCLNNRRVRAAERLLRQSDLPVEAVALQVGFESRSSLYRHMKRVSGSTPSAWRAPGRPTTQRGAAARGTALETMKTRPE